MVLEYKERNFTGLRDLQHDPFSRRLAFCSLVAFFVLFVAVII